MFNRVIQILNEYTAVILLLITLFVFMYLAYSIFRKYILKIDKPIRSKKPLVTSVTIAYFITLFIATLTTRKPFFDGQTNMIFFDSYRNAFIMQNTNELTYLLLNIMMMFPLGILLPLLFNKLKSLAWFVPVILIIILGIEFTQLYTGRGIFDVDDIMNNLLGALIGFGFLKSYFTLKRSPKNYITLILYNLPVILVLSLGLLVKINYELKPYGIEPFKGYDTYNVDNVNITIDPSLNYGIDEIVSGGIYKTDPALLIPDFEELFFTLTGTKYTLTNTYEWDDGKVTQLSNPNHHIGTLTHTLGTNQYTYEPAFNTNEIIPQEALDEDELKHFLSTINVQIPSSMDLSTESNDDKIIYSFTDSNSNEAYDYHLRTIKVELLVDQSLSSITWNEVNAHLVESFPIKSVQEAIDGFSNSQAKVAYPQSTDRTDITIVNVELEYIRNQKGFLYPYYRVDFKKGEFLQSAHINAKSVE